MKNMLMAMASAYSMLGAGAMIFLALSQALSGGMRTETAPGFVDPFTGATLFIWLVCVFFVSVRQVAEAFK